MTRAGTLSVFTRPKWLRVYLQISANDDKLLPGKQWRVRTKCLNDISMAAKRKSRCNMSRNSDAIEAAVARSELYGSDARAVEAVAMPSRVATYNLQTL